MVKKINVDSYQGYCVHCKEKVHFLGIIENGLTGRRQAVGECPECGNKIVRILGRSR